MTDLKTDSVILEKIAAAAKQTMTAEEIRRQKLSFIVGFFGEDSPVTRAQIKKVMAKHEGTQTAA